VGITMIIDAGSVHETNTFVDPDREIATTSRLAELALPASGIDGHDLVMLQLLGVLATHAERKQPEARQESR
jgi:hypothetical protein